MASNVVDLGVTEVNIYRRNYPYTTAVSDQPYLTLIIFSDLKVLGFKDSDNTLKKVLCDASGSSATPAERVFFADSNGEADSSSDLTFDGSELYVQGEQVVHGSTAVPNPITLTNGVYTAEINLSATGVLSISIDGIEQVNYSNGSPD